jgi:sortase A
VSRFLRILSVILVAAGLTVLADVGATLAWKEPLSSIYGSVKQSQARDQLADLERDFPTPADIRRAGRGHGLARAAVLARLFSHRVEHSDPIGRIEVPAIDLDMVVVEGTDTSSLRKGPGHYPDTSLPGERGTVAIAGHRTTYLAPFRHLDQLENGDQVVLTMPYGRFAYRVQRKQVVAPSDTDVIRDTSHQQLVLTACNPLYSAAQRIVVFATITGVSAEPGASGG